MKRSKWKGPFLSIDSSLNKTVTKKKSFVLDRNSLILPKFIGKFCLIHNGKKYVRIKVTDEMVGFKVGEFVPTRTKFSYKKNNK